MAHFEYHLQSSQVANQTFCPGIFIECDENKMQINKDLDISANRFNMTSLSNLTILVENKNIY